MAETIFLSHQAFTWLGSAFTERTPISPFNIIRESGFSESDKGDLIRQGIIKEDNTLSPECYSMLEVLARPEAFAGFRLSSASGNVAKTAYFRNNQMITLDTAGGNIVVGSKVDLDAMAVVIGEITGISRLVNAEVNVRLGKKAALAFASLIDLTRKQALAQYAGLWEMPLGYRADDIAEIAAKAEGTRWISAYIKALGLTGHSLTADEVEQCLDGLKQMNLVESGDYGWRLIGEGYDLATNFLIIENVINVRCGQEVDGQVVTGQAVFLQAGLHDVLMIDIAADSLEFNTISSYTMLEYLQALLVNPPELA